MIVVEVRLSAVLREHLGSPDAGTLHVELPAGATLTDLYAALSLKAELVAFSTVNNQYPEKGYRLRDGDRLRIVAHAVGG
jgi:sulfur carrier protein ThiS